MGMTRDLQDRLSEPLEQKKKYCHGTQIIYSIMREILNSENTQNIHSEKAYICGDKTTGKA